MAAIMIYIETAETDRRSGKGYTHHIFCKLIRTNLKTDQNQ